MKQKFGLITFSAGVGLMAFLVITYWYTWSASPLNDAEIDTYVAAIAAQDQVPGREHDLMALKRFLADDDGLPFYTINLYKFHEEANYAADAGFEGSGRDAFDRFSNVMVRLLVARASHPIFGSDWIFAGGTDWDRIVMVRYRSRRDIVDIFASPEFEAASVHKWAGLRENGRMLVQGVHIPAAYLPAILFALLVTMLTALAGRVIATRSVQGKVGALPPTLPLHCDGVEQHPRGTDARYYRSQGTNRAEWHSGPRAC
jgi:hypothetical protein